ncbi:hypothetical protein, partial [Corynebacterium belfantii]|uniref:hypothetical protein n=1 Tax=Corynebacterium belfantii TaxID=2014537 RepID=UPI001A7EA852
ASHMVCDRKTGKFARVQVNNRGQIHSRAVPTGQIGKISPTYTGLVLAHETVVSLGAQTPELMCCAG